MYFAIGGLQKTSLLDYPGKLSAIVFTQGCNFKCGYCHNPELNKIKASVLYTVQAVIEFLKTRIGKLDGVVITGGEPCIQKDLKDFIARVKQLGFAVKLDTNGSIPDVLEDLLKNNLLDYVAMDIKAPLDKYPAVIKTKIDTEKIKKSARLIMRSGVDYEFRTTVLKNQLVLEDFNSIGNLISGAKKYYLQKFVPSKVLDSDFFTGQTYTDAEFNAIANSLNGKTASVSVR